MFVWHFQLRLFFIGIDFTVGNQPVREINQRSVAQVLIYTRSRPKTLSTARKGFGHLTYIIKKNYYPLTIIIITTRTTVVIITVIKISIIIIATGMTVINGVFLIVG